MMDHGYNIDRDTICNYPPCTYCITTRGLIAAAQEAELQAMQVAPEQEIMDAPQVNVPQMEVLPEAPKEVVMPEKPKRKRTILKRKPVGFSCRVTGLSFGSNDYDMYYDGSHFNLGALGVFTLEQLEEFIIQIETVGVAKHPTLSYGKHRQVLYAKYKPLIVKIMKFIKALSKFKGRIIIQKESEREKLYAVQAAYDQKELDKVIEKKGGEKDEVPNV